MANRKLPGHHSENESDPLKQWAAIPILRSRNVVVLAQALAGDAPKRLVRIYRYEADSTIRRAKRSSWPMYIAKTAEKWHPIEGVTEYLINIAGRSLGMNINEFELYQHQRTIWFCSKYFLNPRRGEALIHGTEIMGDYLEDFKFAKLIADNIRDARELFTFDFVREAVTSLFPKDYDRLLLELVKLLTFDCILGNNDRHFYNWGIIRDINDKNKPRFAPIYDSARGLFWNSLDSTIFRKSDNGTELDRYIRKYARQTKPRMSCEPDKSVNHFGLIRHIAALEPEYAQIVETLAYSVNEVRVMAAVRESAIPLLSNYRVSVITKLLEWRFQQTRNTLL